MTVRIRVARSATESVQAFVVDAVQGATLTGYGLILALVFMVVAGRLH